MTPVLPRARCPSPAASRAAADAAARLVRGQPPRPALAPHHAIRTRSSSARSCCSRPRCRGSCRGSPSGCRRWPDLESLAAAPLADVLRRWQGLGYNNRARRLQECAAAAVAAAPAAGAPSCRARSTACARCPASARTRRAPCSSSPTTTTSPRWTPTCAACSPTSSACPRTSATRELQAVADAVLPRGRSRDWHNALMDYGVPGAHGAHARASPRAAARARSKARGARSAPACCARLLEHGPQPLDDLATALRLPLDEAARSSPCSTATAS